MKQKAHDLLDPRPRPEGSYKIGPSIRPSLRSSFRPSIRPSVCL